MIDALGGIDCAKVVRYEDLAADPIGAVRDLFEFADLSWNAQTERFIESSTRDRRNARYYSIYQNPREAAGKWREALSVDDQARILAIARRVQVGRLFAE